MARLLLLSPFPAGVRRATQETAAFRNRVVAAVTDALLVVHAQPGGKTEALVREVLGWGKRVYTLDLAVNRGLVGLGVGVWGEAGPRQEAGVDEHGGISGGTDQA